MGTVSAETETLKPKLLASFRSVADGILHSNALSSRPGRSSAESMRSGRLQRVELIELEWRGTAQTSSQPVRILRPGPRRHP